MKKLLRENPDSPLAGEMSGHFFLNDKWPGFDDSIYNASRLLEIVGRGFLLRMEESHSLRDFQNYPIIHLQTK